ncbi:four-carbon acid sugar kinase family protein [Salipaludibacillus agaradhaerens]|nr:four-carbon acid sugar kinase family protein [Salipaludibacillus agaradhaerens]
MPMRIGVIADDLTGANATGVRLSKQGFKSATMVQGAPFPEEINYDAVIVDTDSRYQTKHVARSRTIQAIDQFKRWGAKLFSKRIDSTYRGNIGTEIDTMLEQLGEEAVAVIVPSFPDSGRIVIGGYLIVDGVPLQQTDVANDPVQPLTQSYIPALTEIQSDNKVGFLGLQEVLKGADELSKSIDASFSEGCRIVVCDATTNDQIEVIAEAMCRLDRCIISADPGPLTAAYSKAVMRQQAKQERILVAVGSATKLTGQQLSYLTGKLNAEPVYVDPDKLASYTSSWDEEIQRATEAVLADKKQEVLILTTHLPGHSLLNLEEKAKQEKASEQALAKRITDGLAKISRQVLEDESAMFKGCFSSGGDVTASLCSVSRANGIELLDEVLPLAAYGKMIGGYFDGLPIITKGGMVGDKKAIYDSVKFLQTKF